MFVNDSAQSLGVADPVALETMAENRLRAARLLGPTLGDVRGGGLLIHVGAFDDDPVRTYSYVVEFVRVLINPFNAEGAVDYEPPISLDRIASVTAKEYVANIGWFTVHAVRRPAGPRRARPGGCGPTFPMASTSSFRTTCVSTVQLVRPKGSRNSEPCGRGPLRY